MSCKHGNWPPCDLCDEIDAAYEAGRKDAASQPIAGKPVGIVAVSSAGISVGWVENYTPMHNDKLYIHPAPDVLATLRAEVEGLPVWMDQSPHRLPRLCMSHADVLALIDKMGGKV